ncbi:succinyldiaminopimelate transaminase [Marisediminicola senii]|uniref:succinyldiaminopimelate transaminase n=1 Tax=Marisediminicola senii TaxID=2711233 RepID=UPI0013EC2237|nr:succinyldiaminopimelate transaminase [Marisediminicola senii]
MTLSLPDFPWDALVPFAKRARAHPDGIVDLSVGSPVDPTPALIRDALSAATDAHSYPQVIGSVPLREAIAHWFDRRRGVAGLTVDQVMPTIGSKELVAGLPLWLGIGAGDVVVVPRTAYPTYAIGAALVGATVVASDDPAEWPENTRLVWVNSPGNPDGRVLGVDELRAAVDRARELGAVIAGDECYAELAWDAPWAGSPTPSILDPAVTGGDTSGVLAVYSLSKQSNLAGYRAGFIAGCRDTVSGLVAIRKHLGLITPDPVQAAMLVALGDDEHVTQQRDRYRARRTVLHDALLAAGFRIDHSEAGLYLWVTRGDDSWSTITALADLGILAAPGSFYGPAGERHVRLAVTATDERVGEAAKRLRAASFA